jgi:hypothetical protein
VKQRHWCPAYFLIEPLRWKAPCEFYVGIADGATDELLAQVFAAISLCPQHAFQILTGDAHRVQAALAQVIRPRTAPGAQTGHKDVEQFTDEFMASWEYRVSLKVGPIASEYTDGRFDGGGSRSLKEYHKLIDSHYSRYETWWPLSNVTVEGDNP